MLRIGLLALVLIVSAACNLSTTTNSTLSPTYTMIVPEAVVSVEALATRTPLSTGDILGRTALPSTGIPATSVPVSGTSCEVYTTFSGNDPNNKLSLRASPSTNATQIFRVPTNTEVLRVSGSQEVEAEGYHWLNVIYVQSPQMRYQGWIARDSYSVNGVRNPSIATLREAGRQTVC